MATCVIVPAITRQRCYLLSIFPENPAPFRRGAPRNLFRRFNPAESAAVPPVSGTAEFTRASPRAARGKRLRVHRDHQLLAEFAGEHDEGLRRVFDIQIAPIGTEHLACCAADDHHVRPGLDPMLVRVPFGMCADLARQEFHFMVTERVRIPRGMPVMLQFTHASGGYLRGADHDQKHSCQSCSPHSLYFCRFGRASDSSSPRDSSPSDERI